MALPSTNCEVQGLFAKLLEKRFDRQPCCAGILYECMPFLIGHCKVSAAEKFLSFGCVRPEHRLVSSYINRIINVAWCFGHGILLDPEASTLCPFQPVLQGGSCEITLRRDRGGRAYWRSSRKISPNLRPLKLHRRRARQNGNLRNSGYPPLWGISPFEESSRSF